MRDASAAIIDYKQGAKGGIVGQLIHFPKTILDIIILITIFNIL